MNHIHLKILLLPLVIISFILTICIEVSFSDTSTQIATVKKAGGTVTIVRQGRTILGTIGLEICEHDTVRTGRDGSIGIVFNDDTFLSLGPDSMVVIDEFIFAPKQKKFSIVLRMIKGTAAYLSGLISKLAPESAYFKTPTASIGIRGTKFAVKVEGDQIRVVGH